MKVGSFAFKGNRGTDPKLIGTNEYGSSVRTQSWGWTLFAIGVQSVGTQLDLYVQDSADNSSWTNLTASAFEPAAAAGSLILVKNSAVREYLRIHLQGAGSPVASVVAIQINDTSGSLAGGCDLVID